jgi:predicted GH43/DUF377 family glycosyl hydrolase
MDELRTPFKTNTLVLRPSYQSGTFDSHAIDCPFLFYHAGQYWMTYVGWDGIGYRTGLASSDDLFNWTKQGLILDRGAKGCSVTEFNIALTCILRDNELYGPGTLKSINGQFVGTYHAYPAAGYETGPAIIGLCFSEDLRHWHIGEPILKSSEGQAWERGGLYKSWILEHDGTYYLFYNAKNKETDWIEQTGMAVSVDLVRWKRCADNPVLKVGTKGAFDERFASDPAVFRHNNEWVMFYFGLASDGHARDGVAFSPDLLHWEKTNEILVNIGPAGSVDAIHAHKPGLITKDKHLFHFYCAVAPCGPTKPGNVEPEEIRGISMTYNLSPL